MSRRSRSTYIVMVLFAIFVLPVSWDSPSGAATNSTFSSQPPFLPGNVPPLVMLVMGRDHKLYYEAYNDASDLDGDGTLDVGYDPSIDYYGYFDCYKCYTYNSTDDRFEPNSTTADKTCSGASEWSGDFLNYLTMSRIDCLRKILYGGYRSTDGTTETVLERVYIPQDSHTWGKEYQSVANDGYDISDYTPLGVPTSGRHLFASVTLSSNGDPLLRVLENRAERIWEWVAQETYQAHGVGSPTDYVVRVKVGVSGMLESNCEQYPSGVYKPTGLLQKYGESDLMYFGLVTGSYVHNTKGGVLRKTIGSITDEINSTTGQIISGGIIDTIDSLRISGYDHGSHSHDCGGIFDRPMNDGECRMWGNPIAEMMYESLRYFSGAGSATSDFTYSGTTPDSDLGLPLATWDDPYASGNYPYCSKAFMLVFSDTSPSYDTDQLPGTAFGSFSGSLGTLDVESLGNTISSGESAAGSYFIGQNGPNASDYDGTCEAKTVSGFGDIRGLCPEEPTKQGGYYSAAVAYYGRINDLHATATEDQTVTTYGIALSSPLPRIEIPVGSNTVTLVPFAKSAFYGPIDSSEGAFQPTNQIAEFFVKEITSTYGEFRISFEDAEQGNDFDMDALVIYRYQVVDDAGTHVANAADGTKVKVSLVSFYAAGGVQAHLGYHVSGTTGDGTYLDVLDADTGSANYQQYFLDTDRLKNLTNEAAKYKYYDDAGTELTKPPTDADLALIWAMDDADGTANPSYYVSIRTFTPSGSLAATLIKNPLWYAAKWGGFKDKNADDTPDQTEEWDEDGDGVPDTYFYVQNPLYLETQLAEAFASILERMSSGTAAAVVADSQSGVGAVYQAIFYPRLSDSGGNEISWIGDVKGLWLDEHGNLREDTNDNNVMNMTSDKIVDFYFDNDLSRTRIKTYTDTDGDGERDTGSESIVEVNDTTPIWSAGKLLAQRDLSSSPRDIKTWVDDLSSGTVGSVDSGEVVSFNSSNASDLRPYLAVETSGTTETTKLINYIRGEEQTGYRSRTIDVDGTDRVWRLGDIVYSTPTVVGKPKERYDVIYGDRSYANFKNANIDRRNVIYIGANDGMLHAFNGGFYDESTRTFSDSTGRVLGEELWAYVPYNLLPHLQWLALEDYQHVAYVDLKPKVVDAKIFTADATHTDGWGTVLVCGMRFGGGTFDLSESDVNYDWDGDSTIEGGVVKTFRSAYFAFDITDPLNPELMWEFTDANLGFTTSYPTVVYTDNTNKDWWIAFGSGPMDYDGTSSQLGRTYVVKLASGLEPSGSPIATNWGGGNVSFMGDPTSVDINISASQCSGGSCSYSPDVFYIGSSLGTLWRIGCIGGTWAGNQSDFVSLGVTKPITAGPAIAEDDNGRLWVYFGTGKLFVDSDQLNTDTQSLVGVKEPLDWSDCDSDSDESETTIYCVNDCLSAVAVSSANLLDTTDYTVFEGGSVDTDDDLTNGTENTFIGIENEIEQSAGDSDYDGWIIDMTGGERCVTKPTVLGGLVTFSTYLPEVADVCMHEGESYLNAIYYKTGTASWESVIGTDDSTTITEGGETKAKVKRRTSLGYGVASSPSLHIGKTKGAKVIIQTSTGEIVEIKEENLPAAYKSRPLNWVQAQ